MIRERYVILSLCGNMYNGVMIDVTKQFKCQSFNERSNWMFSKLGEIVWSGWTV